MTIAIAFGAHFTKISRKIFWIKWDTICLKKKDGGLGVKRLREFNISLLGKWVWRVLEERESLWNVVLQVKYGVVGGRGLLDNIVRKVGDGRSTMFWEDPWLLDVPLVVSYPRLFELSDHKGATVREMCLLGWGTDGGA
ncbi:hypothetical protein MTR_8g069860 [Medicago truncatula]|uniref:Uncharacterized protein n=1 Tax=Medicago truncatula TaxID=3880 RepID=A0A072TTM2_MEDTR|nr:hypothetical protein MTR_8g069860 [Medicago truncatula]